MNHRIDLRNGKRQMLRAKKFFTQTKEGNQKRDLQRIDEIIHDLDCGKIQTKRQRSDARRAQ